MYLETWYDPRIPIRDGETAELIIAEEVERLLKLRLICVMAAGIPRRLGPEATSDELAADKVRCRRIQHVANQLLEAYEKSGAKIPVATPASNREAAQVDWDRWWGDHQVWLTNRTRYVATWGLTRGDNQRSAKTLVVRLNNEFGWLRYAMR